MPRKPIIFELDFMIKDIFPRFAVKQFDDVSFNITPIIQGEPYNTANMTGKIFVGVNNDIFMQTENITVSSNNINVLLDKNMLQKHGRAYAEIELTDSNGTITSSSFIFDIDAKIGEGGIIPGEFEGFVAKYERLIKEFKNQVDSTVKDCNTRVDNKLAQLQKDYDTTKNEVVNKSDDKIVELENRFQKLTSEQQQDSEVIDARDGEVSLKARLERDLAKGKIITQNVEGSYITVPDSVEGNITNIEILGNTVQNTSNLADIKSVGIKKADGTYEMSILSCGKNLNSSKIELGTVRGDNGNASTSLENFRTKDFVKVKGGTPLIASTNDSNFIIQIILQYDKDLKYISSISNGNICNNSTKYIKIVGRHKTIGTNIETLISNLNIQLEEGTVATPYEPYKSNKCDILLPCQLEKVGDVADRLYYDDVEKAWCIEKWNVTSTVKFEDVTEYRKLDVTDVLLFKKPLDSYGYGIANGDDFDAYLLEGKGIVKGGYNALIGIGNLTNTSSDRIGIGYEKGTFSSKEEAYEDIKNKTLYYKLKVPQKIVLPLDMQIQLNSFFGTINMWLESGDVEGTIKATAPKSLGASVQSLNTKTDMLDDRVSAIEGLKDSQNMDYQTDKGYLVAEATQNGVVKDVKIQGKTLVNLIDFSSIVTGGSASGNFIKSNNYIKATLTSSGSKTCYIKPMIDVSNRLITVIIDNKSTSYCNFDKRNGFVNIKNLKSGLNIFTVNTDNLEQGFSIGFTGTLNASDVIEFSIMILEGDHTQNPPSYFEGLKSVGQDVDVIEVLSVKSDGNLFDGVIEIGKILPSNGTDYSDTNTIRSKNKVFLPKGDYTLNGKPAKAGNFFKYDKQGNYLGWGSIISSTGAFTVDVDCYVRFQVVETNTLDFNISINKVGSNSTNHKSHKKQLLYYNELGELKPIPQLREWDILEEKGDKTLYRLCSGIRTYQAGDENNVNVITDMINTVYKLSEPKVYECPNLNLSSYASETMISLNSGAINPRMEFSITSHINELVKVNQARINELESYVHKVATTILSEGYQGLAYMLYPEDFTEENKIELLAIEPM